MITSTNTSVLQCQFCGCYFTPKRYKGTACCSNLCATKLNYYRKHQFETPYEMGQVIRENYVKELISNSVSNDKERIEDSISEEDEKLIRKYKLKSKTNE